MITIKIVKRWHLPTFTYLLALRQSFGFRTCVSWYSHSFRPRLRRNTRRSALSFSSHEVSPISTSRLILPLRRHPLTPPCIRVLVSRSEMIGATFLLSPSSNSLIRAQFFAVPLLMLPQSYLHHHL
jgi:hypothetical protein